MLQVLRGESTGDAQRDAELQRQLAELLDKIVQRLIDEGYLNVKEAPQMPAVQQPPFGPGGLARGVGEQAWIFLTEKGIRFLGVKTREHLLGGGGTVSFRARPAGELGQ